MSKICKKKKIEEPSHCLGGRGRLGMHRDGQGFFVTCKGKSKGRKRECRACFVLRKNDLYFDSIIDCLNG